MLRWGRRPDPIWGGRIGVDPWWWMSGLPPEGSLGLITMSRSFSYTTFSRNLRELCGVMVSKLSRSSILGMKIENYMEKIGTKVAPQFLVLYVFISRVVWYHTILGVSLCCVSRVRTDARGVRYSST